MPLRTFEERQAVVKCILGSKDERALSTQGKDEMARALAERLGLKYQKFLDQKLLQILSPPEVQQVVKAGIDIQLHTHRHRTPLDKALFVREIEDNRRRIIDFTGKNPVHFCYPSGQYSPEFFGWLRGCGVKSATTCESGLTGRNSLSMKLPRVLDDSGMTLLRFESVLSGLFV